MSMSLQVTSCEFFSSMAMNTVPTSVAANENMPTVASSPVRKAMTTTMQSMMSKMMVNTKNSLIRL